VLFANLLLSFALAGGPAQLTRDLQRASGLLANGSVIEAVTLLRQVVRSNPASAEAHLILGRALALIPRREEAIGELSRAVELQPDSADAHNTLGTALARFAEFERARHEFETAIALDAKLLDPHVNLALILAQNNEPAAAGDQVARALALCGICTKASYLHSLEGKIYDKRGMPREAVAAFERRSGCVGISRTLTST
jgi:Tfp pilus assembly protein PilF